MGTERIYHTVPRVVSAQAQRRTRVEIGQDAGP